MDEETPYEPAIAKGDGSPGIPVFKPLAEKEPSLSVAERIRLLEMAI